MTYMSIDFHGPITGANARTTLANFQTVTLFLGENGEDDANPRIKFFVRGAANRAKTVASLRAAADALESAEEE